MKPWVTSYAEGVRAEIDAPISKNLPELFSDASRRFTGRTAFTTVLPNGMSGTLTFDQVHQWSDAFAVYLREIAGIKSGDRVAIQLPNCLSYPIAAIGILKAGAIIVNTNPLYTPSEMAHQYKDSGAKAIVILDLFADKLEPILKETAIQTVIRARIAEYFPWLQRQLVGAVQKYKDKSIPRISYPCVEFQQALMQGEAHLQGRSLSAQKYWQDLTLDSIAALQYTGGTTGVSKGAVLSHGCFITNLMQVIEFAGRNLRPGGETILTALPLYHIFAFTVNFLVLYHSGAHNVLIPNPRPLTNLRKAFEKYPVSWLTGVNTLFNGLCNEEWFRAHPPAHLRTAVAGGMALQSAVAERWEKVAHCPVVEGYGLTESSPVLCFNPIGGRVKKETIGVPVPSTDIKCVDDNGKEVPIGERGELIARGPQIMKSYWQRPDETAKTIKDGWLYTGDIATVDADGYFKIVDRKKDMILVSGFNVFPNEVEDAIAQHPGVLEVAVIGIPDGESGEAVKAFIHPKDPNLTVEQVRAHCRQTLTGYKIPKHVEFRTDLPKTPIGKILRKELRAGK